MRRILALALAMFFVSGLFTLTGCDKLFETESDDTGGKKVEQSEAYSSANNAHTLLLAELAVEGRAITDGTVYEIEGDTGDFYFVYTGSEIEEGDKNDIPDSYEKITSSDIKKLPKNVTVYLAD